MTDPFAWIPRACTCAAEVRVDTADRLFWEGEKVALHGLHHCFSYERGTAP